MKHSNVKDLKYFSHTICWDIYIHNFIASWKSFDSYWQLRHHWAVQLDIFKSCTYLLLALCLAQNCSHYSSPTIVTYRHHPMSLGRNHFVLEGSEHFLFGKHYLQKKRAQKEQLWYQRMLLWDIKCYSTTIVIVFIYLLNSLILNNMPPGLLAAFLLTLHWCDVCSQQVGSKRLCTHICSLLCYADEVPLLYQ